MEYYEIVKRISKIMFIRAEAKLAGDLDNISTSVWNIAMQSFINNSVSNLTTHEQIDRVLREEFHWAK